MDPRLQETFLGEKNIKSSLLYIIEGHFEVDQ